MFHEVQFPVGISYGSTGGPGFSTSIIEMDSGNEQRVVRWSGPRRTYALGYGVKSLSDLYTVLNFVIARDGPGFGFRLKDWSDFTTASDGRSAPASTDQSLGTGDGTTTAFRLRKRYFDAGSTRWRTLGKPVVGTTVCAVGGTPTSAFTVDTTTGWVTFSSAPTVGANVTAGCEFDVPCRFGKELDNGLQVSIDAFESGTIPNIPAVEIIDTQSIADEYNFGGCSELSLSYNRTLAVSDGRVIIVAPVGVSGRTLSLPDPATLPPGGPYFFLSQSGSYTFDLKNHLGTTLLTVGVGKSVIVVLTVDGGGTKYWYAL